MTFTKGWDVDIISQQESTNNEMAVLSTYLTDIVGSIDKNGNSLRHTRPIMCNTDYEQGQNNKYLRHGSQPEAQPTISGSPQLQPYWAVSTILCWFGTLCIVINLTLHSYFLGVIFILSRALCC